MVPTAALDNGFYCPRRHRHVSQSLWHVHSKFGFAAATCRESKVPAGKAVFFFFGIDMLGLQSSGLEMRQLPRQWDWPRWLFERCRDSVPTPQDRGRNEGRSENPRRSPSAQLDCHRSGEFQEKNWSRWQTGRSTEHRAEVAKNLLHNLGRTCCFQRVGTRVRAPMRREWTSGVHVAAHGTAQPQPCA